ncbi:hypothetical protein DFH09DRAFT_1341831 [Mycena vulgaris]|nr:hypothetical protein DFH09DRAFT_1341831 [Mycena vulgaris]
MASSSSTSSSDNSGSLLFAISRSVPSRMADPFFEDSVPDIYANFLAITRFHQHLETIIRRGHAHGLDDPLPGEADRPYPNRPLGYLGVQCAACPERGVNMPLVVNIPKYLRHLISQHLTLDGNFKANLFFKRDDGSDKALTDGRMYFPKQAEFDEIAKAYVVSEEDKEVPCKAHIGSIRHQGSVRYGNTAVSGVVSSACDHAVVGAFIDMIKGEAFALGTYAQREHLKHANSPPHDPATTTPTVYSYDSWCSFVVNLVNRAVTIFPEEEWLHTLLAEVEGQIPADHINGHGLDCQTIWQAVYFGCRAHFHGETAEMIWAFLNPLGSSTRQSTGAARKDIINFVMDARNQWKVLRQAQLLADERLAALQLFEVHMAVVQELSSQHPTEVPRWSRMSRITTKSTRGSPHSVYQHETTKVLTIDNMLASMIADEREKMTCEDEYDPSSSVARWLHDGIGVEREQILVIALLKSHQEHPLQDTWATITTLRDSLNLNLKKFRERQREIYPRLKLSALDIDEPELTAIQLPSYRMKHGQRLATGVGANDQDLELREGEIKLRCIQADSGILAVRSASHALSAVKRTRELDYRGQAGKSRSDRSLQKAELMKAYEITMYNRARDALVHLGHLVKDAVEPYPPLTHRDTRRKETHLHRAKGDSRVFDGTAWYLQSGVMLSRSALVSSLSSPVKGNDEGEREEPQLLTGTQSLKRTGTTRTPRPAKRLRDMAPDDVVVEASSASEAEASDLERSPSKLERRRGKDKEKKGKGKKRDGWIWLERVTGGRNLGNDEKLAEYKMESDRVQWFRAEAEMYHWIEQYERKHAELFRVIERYRRDSVVWAGLADRESERIGGVNGAVTFARMQAAMYRRLEHNAKVIFKSPDSGAHADWVSATTFDELVTKIDGWREVVFKWMDTMERERVNTDRARVVEGMAARIARNVALEYANNPNNQPASPNDDTVSIPSSSDESGADGPERTLPTLPASPIKVDNASAQPSSQATLLSPLYELEAHLRRLSLSAPRRVPPNSPLSSAQSLPDLVPDFTLGSRPFPVKGDEWKRGRTPVRTPQSQPRMPPTQGPAVQCHMLRMVPRPFGLPLPYQKASSVGDWLQSKQKFAGSPRPRKNFSGNSKQSVNRGRSTPRPSPKKIKRCYYCTAADHLVALCPLREPID